MELQGCSRIVRHSCRGNTCTSNFVNIPINLRVHCNLTNRALNFVRNNVCAPRDEHSDPEGVTLAKTLDVLAAVVGTLERMENPTVKPGAKSDVAGNSRKRGAAAAVGKVGCLVLAAASPMTAAFCGTILSMRLFEHQLHNAAL